GDLVPVFDGGDDTGGRPQGLLDGEDGHDVALIANGNDQAVDDGQGEGHGEAEARALPELAFDSDAAAQLLDLAPDYVHADAAAGNVGDLFRGREAGLENEVVNLLVGEGGAMRDDTLLDGLGEDAIAVHPGTVVGDLDDHVAGVMRSAQFDSR